MKIENFLEVRDCGQKGRGLYTTAPIKAGTEVISAFGLVVPNSRVHSPPYEVIGDEVCFQIDELHHIYPISPNSDRWYKFWFTNHSCEPNCGIRGSITLVSLRDIAPEEEITFDYSMTDADFEGMNCHPNIPMVCLCNSLSCRGVITGDDWRLTYIQQRYNGFFSNYIQKMIDQINAQKTS